MTHESLAEFDQRTLEDDHVAALQFDTLYDDLEGISSSQKAQIVDNTISAIDSTNAPKPNSTDVSHGTQKRAIRWTQFRHAYLNDLEKEYHELDESLSDDHPWSLGLETEYKSYEDKHRFFMNSQLKAEEMAYTNNPAAAVTFEALELERVRHLRNGDDSFDPLQLERQYSFNVLLNTLDTIVEGPGSTQDDIDHGELRSCEIFTLPDNLDSTDRPLRVAIERYKVGDSNAYSIGVAPDDAEYVDDEAVGGAEYYIVEEEGEISITAHSYRHEVPFAALTTLDLAHAISRDQKFSVERPAFQAYAPRWKKAAARAGDLLFRAGTAFLDEVGKPYGNGLDPRS